MTHDTQESRQAEQLNRAVTNIVAGDKDLFDGIPARRLLRETMELVDLATFIIPAEDGSDGEFEQRMCALALDKSSRLSQDAGKSSRSVSRSIARFVNPILGMGLAAAAFFAALFMEPLPEYRNIRSIDTSSRMWYNYEMGKYMVGSAQDGVELISCFGFSGGGSGYRGTACR